MKKHIPNLITLLNLFCGSIAVIFAVEDNLFMAAVFVILGIIFDFFDGFAARILDVKSELGLQLDSLADMVTSGVVPGLVMYKMFQISDGVFSLPSLTNSYSNSSFRIEQDEIMYLPYFGLLVILASCYRLAKFNIDTRQSDSFIGLPTPANTLFLLSLPLVLMTNDVVWINELIVNKWFLIGLTVFSCYMLNAEIPLFSLKMKTYGFKENAIKYVFLMLSVLLLVFLQFLAIPIIIVLYVLISVISNIKK